MHVCVCIRMYMCMYTGTYACAQVPTYACTHLHKYMRMKVTPLRHNAMRPAPTKSLGHHAKRILADKDTCRSKDHRRRETQAISATQNYTEPKPSFCLRRIVATRVMVMHTYIHTYIYIYMCVNRCVRETLCIHVYRIQCTSRLKHQN